MKMVLYTGIPRFPSFFIPADVFLMSVFPADPVKTIPRDAEALYEVRIIDNDHNTYQEVMQITMLALGVEHEQAFAIAWEVDHLGSCVVAHAPKEEAEEMAGLIRTIGIEVQVNPINHTAC